MVRESGPLLRPDELFFLDGEDGKLFGAGDGLTGTFASAPSSSKVREALLLPKLQRLVLF